MEGPKSFQIIILTNYLNFCSKKKSSRLTATQEFNRSISVPADRVTTKMEKSGNGQHSATIGQTSPEDG